MYCTLYPEEQEIVGYFLSEVKNKNQWVLNLFMYDLTLILSDFCYFLTSSQIKSEPQNYMQTLAHVNPNS